MTRVLAAVIALLAIAGSQSCASHTNVRDPVAAFWAGDPAYASAYFRAYAEKDEDAVALALNNYAMSELVLGNARDSRPAFVDAGRIMGNFDGTTLETLGAVIGREDSKRWKGDPYEVAMNSFYAALLYYMRGEYDNALAGCKNGILAGGDADEGYRSDFTLLYWFEGKCHAKLGKPDAARQSFGEARESRTRRGDAGEIESLLTGGKNATFVVDIGVGPLKYASGEHGEVIRFAPGNTPEAYAVVSIDGRNEGRTLEMANLHYQATHRGGREIDGILKGKAIFKTASAVGGIAALIAADHQSSAGSRDKLAAVGAGLLLLSILTSAEADTRCWATLPAAVHALEADVEPGLHTVTLDFYDRGGAPLSDFRQVWHDVPFFDDRENVFYFRSGPRFTDVTYPAGGPDPALVFDRDRLAGTR